MTRLRPKVLTNSTSGWAEHDVQTRAGWDKKAASQWSRLEGTRSLWGIDCQFLVQICLQQNQHQFVLNSLDKKFAMLLKFRGPQMSVIKRVLTQAMNCSPYLFIYMHCDIVDYIPVLQWQHLNSFGFSSGKKFDSHCTGPDTKTANVFAWWPVPHVCTM